MSKELEAILSLRNRLVEKGIKDQFLDELLILETALKDYEKQQEIHYVLFPGRYNGKTGSVRALLKLKAFEIIKEKRIDVDDLMNELEWSDGFKSYNERSNHISLTKEEYDLLREALI